MPQQSLAVENLLCSFPTPQRRATEPRVGLPAAPRIGRAKNGQRRHGCTVRDAEGVWGGGGGGAGDREKGRPVSASHVPGRFRTGRFVSPFAVISGEGSGGGRGEAHGGFGEGCSRAAVCDCREEPSRCGGERSGAQCVTPPAGSRDPRSPYKFFFFFF